MRAAVAEISSKSFRDSSPDQNTKHAWARLVRQRFHGQNLVKRCMSEWDLTEGRARGVVYAQITQDTIDAILKRDPVEGFALGLEILAIVTGIKLEEYVDHKGREAARERIQWEAAERSNQALAAALSERRAFARRGAE